nr:coat protein [Olive leaf yellowing-associated virus]
MANSGKAPVNTSSSAALDYDDVRIGEGVVFTSTNIKAAATNLKASPKMKDTSKLNNDALQTSIANYLKKALKDTIQYPDDDEAYTTLILGIMWRYRDISTSRSTTFTDNDKFVIRYKEKDYEIKDLVLRDIMNSAPHFGQVNPLRKFLRGYSPLWYELVQHLPPSSFDTTLAFKWGMPAEYACYSPDWFEPVDAMSEEAIQACRLKTAEAVKQAQTQGVQSKVLNLAQLGRRA